MTSPSRPEEASILVQKYGGSSVADPDKIRQVAGLIAARRAAGFRLCVVVSAMGKTTDGLLAQARSLTRDPPRRELDMLLSCGERASMALLAMALHDLGVPSISFTGSQSGILTNDRHSDARILEVRPYRVQDELDGGRVVIVAGFQGVSYRKEITTLGRGGSDTTAVALAAALGADCEIYSDVDGVFSADPRTVPEAQRLAALSYEEMQELAAAGAKVLHAQAVDFARARGIAVYCKQTGGRGDGTIIRRDAPAPEQPVRGVAHRVRQNVLGVADGRGLEALGALLEAHGIAAGQILGACGPEPGARAPAGLLLLIPPEDAHNLERCLTALPPGVHREDGLGTVTLVAAAAGTAGRLVAGALGTLREQGLTPRGLGASSLGLTLLLPTAEVERAARCLHARFVSPPSPGRNPADGRPSWTA